MAASKKLQELVIWDKVGIIFTGLESPTVWTIIILCGLVKPQIEQSNRLQIKYERFINIYKI